MLAFRWQRRRGARRESPAESRVTAAGRRVPPPDDAARHRRSAGAAAFAAPWLLAVLMLLAAPGPVAAQFRGVRFEIAQVGDTTLTFPRGDERWIRPGMDGVVVDPRRRDALVARVRVLSVASGVVTAVVTGQTTRVLTEHVVIMDEPRRPWYRTVYFWSGAALGFALGMVTGSLF